ncbi:pyridoxamine 5'-phosphate oxidase family protein [Streptomyces sp. NPDC059096]|uniref:pyridoxamine 5'-phosphate oxidase family protein n=1 Tax=Streptomyces sp. NPDC059096 TaxID=3346727 RepID=UPI0036801FF7
MTFIRADFVSAEPRFAEALQRRFEKYSHPVLATVGKDGSPRVTGLEVAFLRGELWLGMMPHSWKARDLERDPRFALHANPGPDGRMADGGIGIGGRAVEVRCGAVRARSAADRSPPEPFLLFRAGPEEVVQTAVDCSDLLVRVWRQGAPSAARGAARMRARRARTPGEPRGPPPW